MKELLIIISVCIVQNISYGQQVSNRKYATVEKANVKVEESSSEQQSRTVQSNSKLEEHAKQGEQTSSNEGAPVEQQVISTRKRIE